MRTTGLSTAQGCRPCFSGRVLTHTLPTLRSVGQLRQPLTAVSSSSTVTRVIAAGGRSSASPDPFSTRSETPDEWSKEAGREWVAAMQLDPSNPDIPALLQEMGVAYDPEKLAFVLSTRWPQVYGRAVRIAASLGGFIAALGRDYALGNWEEKMPRRARELCRLLTRLGPSFVKIGQALSARPDLVPKPYLDALSDLQDRLPPFPDDEAYALIEAELGKAPRELFAELSASPVAAASLGQVYKGRLKTGEAVAIKVQRPGIGESMCVDMLLLRRLMGVVDRSFGLSQPLVPLVDEFAARLFSELDYIAEGHNCERFQLLYGGMPRVRTPAIYWEFTSRKILAMEWIDGVKLTNREAMDAAGLDVVDFVDVGIECTLRQLLEHGYFHADPHPGNLLAMTSGELCYLDFGMMSSAPQYARYGIMAHVVHLVNRDYEAMCRDYYDLQFMDRSVDTSPIAPALAEFFDDVLDRSVSQLNFKAIVDGLGTILFQFPFRVPAYYALILRSLTVLEGLALTADPNYKLLAKAYPYMARRLLTDPAPELRASFEDLVLKDGQFRWNRLENLVREGSKSQDYDPAQLWLLLDWLLTPAAESVRVSLTRELARVLDAVAASDVRRRILSQTGSLAITERLVPEQPSELEALERAQLLQTALTGQIQVPTMQLQPTGPFGLPTPQDLYRAMSTVQESLAETLPRFQQLLQRPGATDAISSVSVQLAQRFAARAIKFAFADLDTTAPPRRVRTETPRPRSLEPGEPRRREL